jgi:hypothetical protein
LGCPGKRIYALRLKEIKRRDAARRGVTLRGPKPGKDESSLAHMICVLVRYGHAEYDVLHRYTIPKVKRYYEALVALLNVENYNQAVMMYTVGKCVAIPQSREHQNDIRKMWNKYIDSIDPDLIKDPGKKSKRSLKRLSKIKEIQKG